MNKAITTSVTISILLYCSAVTAQSKQNGYKWMIGINAGTMIYQGDLTPSSLGSYKTPSFTMSLFAARILNPYFAVRANAAFGSLKGDDAAYSSPAWRRSRNLNFSTPVKEFSAQLVWNPFGNNSNEIGLRVTPYLFGGAGVSFLNIKRDYSRLDKNVFPSGSKEQSGLLQDTAHALPGSLLVLPVGAGLSFYLSPRFSINWETSFRYTFTDYLDGFSYVANPNRKDFYHSHTIGLVYRFGGTGGSGTGCPVMKY